MAADIGERRGRTDPQDVAEVVQLGQPQPDSAGRIPRSCWVSRSVPPPMARASSRASAAAAASIVVGLT